MNNFSIFETLNKNCPRVAELTAEQQTSGLPYDLWFAVSKLIASVSIYFAIMFSSLSTKHSEDSEYKIRKLEEVEPKKLMTNCTTLGCSEEQIEKCHSRVTSVDGRITNSPITFLKKLSSEAILLEMYQDIINKTLTEMIAGNKNKYTENEPMKALVYLQKYDDGKFKSFKEAVTGLEGISKSDFNRNLKEAKKKFPLVLTDFESSKMADYFEFDYNTHGKLIDLNGIKFSKFVREDHQLVFDVIRGFYIYDRGHYRLIGSNEMARLIRAKLDEVREDQWRKSVNENILDALQVTCPTSNELQDSEKYINLENGLFNLETWELEEHNSEIYSTFQLPYPYDEKALAPAFADYLESTFDGDKLLITLVQEMLGYCLTREVKAEKFFILLGEGSNGKSVMIEIIKEMVGQQNTASLSLKDLTSRFDPALLQDKLVNIPSENEPAKEGMNSEALKAIVSGDQIKGEMKYKDAFFFNPYATLIFAMNRLPFTRDKSYGLERRMIIIPFDVIFKGSEEAAEGCSYMKMGDVNLRDKLKSEKSGILNFALEGLKRLRENNFQFTQVDTSKKLLEEYKEEINPLYNFFTSKIIMTDQSNKLGSKELRAAFNAWCEANHIKKSQQMSSTTFLREFRAIAKSRGIDLGEYKSSGQITFKGLLIKKESNAFGTSIYPKKQGTSDQTEIPPEWLDMNARKRPQRNPDEEPINQMEILIDESDDEE